MIAQNFEQFIEGAVQRGMPDKDAHEIWELIIKFAGYGFNKSHSTAYALVAYQTAYLKSHYPVEFMAALLSGDIPGRNFKIKDSLVEHLEDSRRMEIEIVAPDVNHSAAEFSVEDRKIFFGLAAIKGCGGSAADSIVSARNEDGPFRDLFDFCERVDASGCSRATIETLIKAGAFDSLGARRAQLMNVVERAMQAGASKLKDRRSGQKSLFDAMTEEEEPEPVVLPDVPEFPERERLMLEKEVLGFYLSSHPLAEYEQTLNSFCSHSTDNLDGVKDRAEVMMGGIISSIKVSYTKKNAKYAMFDMEDTTGNIRCIAWPGEYDKTADQIQPDAIVLIRGVLDRRGGDEANLIVNEMIPLDQVNARYTRGLRILVDQARHGDDILPKIREIVRYYPGNREVQLVLALDDGSRVHLKSSRGLDVKPEVQQRVEELLGPGSCQVMLAKP